MTSAPGAEACYRHPDRPSWTLCQRCGRTICGKCQIQAPVGVQCPECVREAKVTSIASHREQRRLAYGGPVKRGVRRWLGMPTPVTTTIIALTAAVGILQIVTGGMRGVVTQSLLFYAPFAVAEPWRFVTAALVHGGLLHFVFNMLTLYLVGRGIEQRLGRLPFLAIYVVTAAWGSLAVTLLSGSAVVGASGAIFGLFGIYIGLQRMLGGRFDPQILIIVGVNLVIGLFLSGVSWQAHVGGLVAGIALGFWIGANLRRRETRGSAWIPIAVVGGAAVSTWIGLLLVLL